MNYNEFNNQVFATLVFVGTRDRPFKKSSYIVALSST
jgi:hypothetical protein